MITGVQKYRTIFWNGQKKIGIDDAWTVLENEGYKNQFEGNWKMVHDDVPVVGRALTALFMPSRPDVEKNIKERGYKFPRKEGQYQFLAHRGAFQRGCICYE